MRWNVCRTTDVLIPACFPSLDYKSYTKQRKRLPKGVIHDFPKAPSTTSARAQKLTIEIVYSRSFVGFKVDAPEIGKTRWLLPRFLLLHLHRVRKQSTPHDQIHNILECAA